ncbi:WD40 repeat-like protein [Peniophora sp. CONT]|nr:WD40 repeat-like protein [Peniophora sp. CONT]
MSRTEYELQREANIARNRALLEELHLKEAVKALGIPAKKASPAPGEKKAKPVQPAKRKRAADDEPVLRRQSTRLRRTAPDPDETPAQKRAREREEEKARQKAEEDRLAAEEAAREATKPRHDDLDLETLIRGEGLDDTQISSTRTYFQSIAETPIPKRLPRQDAYVFDEEKEEKGEVKALRARMEGLKVVARAKVTTDRIYSAAYHPEPSKDLVFFGDKHGQLGIWDARAEAHNGNDDDDDDDDRPVDEREGGKYWRLQPHWPATSKSSISSIKFDPFDSSTVYTSAYDCTVRALSFESGVSRELFHLQGTLINCLDVVPGTREMWLSDASGGVTHLDLREDTQKTSRWYQLSDQKIGSISVNPTNPAFLLTASNTRLMKVWDARKLSAIPAADDSLDFDADRISEYSKSKAGKAVQRGEFQHGKSVSSAYWDPRGRSIVSTSYDDTLRLWDVNPSMMAKDAPFKDFKPATRIKHNCQTGRWLTVLKAQWSANPDVYPHFTVGNMDHSVNVYSAKGELLAKLADSTKITAVQAVTCSHPSVVERIATGNGSGRCVLWAPADD